MASAKDPQIWLPMSRPYLANPASKMERSTSWGHDGQMESSSHSYARFRM